MLKINLIEFAKYWLVLIDIVKEDKVGSSEHKSIKRIKYEIVKILARLKSQNLYYF